MAHQIRERPIPDDLPELFDSMGAHVVLLNEFVDGPTRVSFYDALDQRGYTTRQISCTPGAHNQVLAVSRSPFTIGDLRPPTLGDRMDGSAISNFLHVQFDDFPLEMVGLRAPAYERPADVRAYWSEVAAIMLSVTDRPILFAGDINMNPFKRAGTPDAPRVPFEYCKDYTVPNPVGEWSFRDKGGRWVPTRIDHVLHTSALQVSDARYIAEHQGRFLAGLKAHNPISDHAALVFSVDPCS